MAHSASQSQCACKADKQKHKGHTRLGNSNAKERKNNLGSRKKKQFQHLQKKENMQYLHVHHEKIPARTNGGQNQKAIYQCVHLIMYINNPTTINIDSSY
jgi:hypothetical protein